jgi:uncharacterized membrane protein YedE/YeeE
MKSASALLAGLLFGTGLSLSGMLDPVRVIGFLDFGGAWDPSLVFVLGGAVSVTAAGYGLCRRLRRPMFAGQFEPPMARNIDARLLAGAAVFGIGWGLSGFCPGPGIASLSLCKGKSFAFVAAMLLGMALHDLLTRRHSDTSRAATRAA